MSVLHTATGSVRSARMAGDDLFRELHLLLASLAPQSKSLSAGTGDVPGKSEPRSFYEKSSEQLEVVKGGQR